MAAALNGGDGVMRSCQSRGFRMHVVALCGTMAIGAIVGVLLHNYGVGHEQILVAPTHIVRPDLPSTSSLEEQIRGSQASDSLLFDYALALYRDKRYEEAADVARRLTEKRPSIPAGYMVQAYSLTAQGKHRFAAEVVRDMLRQRPSDPKLLSEAYELLGDTSRWRRRYREAEQYYRTALQHDNSNVYAHLGLSITYERLGQHNDMRQSALAAVTYARTQFLKSAGYYYLARSYEASGDRRRCYEAYHRAVSADPSGEYATLARNRLH